MVILFSLPRKCAFCVHKELLCYYTPYYRSLLSGRWADGINTRTFIARTTEPALSLFVKWLYTRDITDSRNDIIRWDLLELYVFSNSMLALALQRDIMTALYSAHKVDLRHERTRLLCYGTISLLYKHLPDTSPLRKFVAATYIRHWFPENDINKDHFLDAPQEFLYMDMNGQALLNQPEAKKARRHLSMYQVNDASDMSCCRHVCYFHAHESEEERAASKFYFCTTQLTGSVLTFPGWRHIGRREKRIT